jgi:hypothetical protein
MKRIRRITPLLLFIVTCGPALLGADLSSYRGFQLGMSLNAAVKHSGMDASEVTAMHKRPALIQALLWRPGRFAGTRDDRDPVDQVDFSFFDGQLFRIIIDYDREKVAGLTTDDLFDGISAQYGAVTRPGVDDGLSSQFSDETAQVLARWEDANYSLNLVPVPYSATLRVVIFDKILNTRAEAAIAKGIRLDVEEAPGLLNVKEQNAKTDLNRNRIANKMHFRP